MAKYCKNCGSPLSEETKFCPNCGAAQDAQSAQSAVNASANNIPSGFAGNGAVREGIPAPGFSDRVNHPEILAAVKKNRRSAGIFALFIVPLPLIGFIVYSTFDDNMDIGQAAVYGGIVSAIFLAFALYSFIKERAKNTYEATVIDKRSEWTYRHTNTDSRERYMEYTTIVRTASGKKKKIVEHEGSLIWAYNYLQIGDRFRYHPQFHFPYELYDKSKAPYIVCVSCTTQNPVEADRCCKCGLPLLK